jgi:uncharacterized protein YfkK (UPF0435 family)
MALRKAFGNVEPVLLNMRPVFPVMPQINLNMLDTYVQQFQNKVEKLNVAQAPPRHFDINNLNEQQRKIYDFIMRKNESKKVYLLLYLVKAVLVNHISLKL